MNKPGLIYLANPYSSPDPDVRERRWDAACEAAADLMRQGHLVFSPIAHTHPIAQYGLAPNDGKFWKKQDAPIMDVCDSLAVLTLRGWRRSVGVQAEIAAFKAAGKPIDYCRLVTHADKPWRVLRKVYPND